MLIFMVKFSDYFFSLKLIDENLKIKFVNVNCFKSLN